MTRRLPLELTGGQAQYACFLPDELDAVETAATALSADLRFEHLGRPSDDVWYFAAECWLDQETDHVPAFIRRHERQLVEAVCYIPVEFLTVETEIELPAIRLLPVSEPRIPQTEAPWFALGQPVGSVAAVPATGTDYGRMAERARAAASHALRVLRVGLGAHNSLDDRQLRFRLGVGYAFDARLTGWNQRPGVAYGLILGKSLAVALGQPVATLPAEPATDVGRQAVLALAWMERATLTGDAVVAMLYRFFALEALLGRKSGRNKALTLAFRQTMLSHLVTGSFEHPDATLFLYSKVRNAAVHGDQAPELSWQVTTGFELTVRSALNQFLQLAKQFGLTDAGDLLRLLDQHPDRSELAAWMRSHGGPRWTGYLDRMLT